MDSQKTDYCHFMVNFSLFVLMILVVTYGNASGATKSVEITVIGGAESVVGNRMGSFEATYLGKKIEVVFYHPNIKVYKGKKEVNVTYLHTTGDEKSVIDGKKIELLGRWQNQKTFEAYKIFLPSDIKKIGER